MEEKRSLFQVLIVFLVSFYSGTAFSVGNGLWDSITLDVTCDSADERPYCEIKRFKYFPDGTFELNGVKSEEMLPRWRQRGLEKRINPFTESDLKKPIICSYKQESSDYHESVSVQLTTGESIVQFVRFRDGRCFMNTKYSLYKNLSEAAKNRGRPH